MCFAVFLDRSSDMADNQDKQDPTGRIVHGDLDETSSSRISTKPVFFRFLDLPRELRDIVYDIVVEQSSIKCRISRETGRRVFMQSDPTYPNHALTQVNGQVRDEYHEAVESSLYKESDIHVQIWARHLLKPLNFSNLSYDNIETSTKKIHSFQQIRFTLADGLDLKIEQSKSGKGLQLTYIAIPVFDIDDDLQHGYVLQLIQFIKECLQFVSVTGGFSPLVAKRFVFFLLDLMIKAKGGEWEGGAMFPEMDYMRGWEEFGVKELKRGMSVLNIQPEETLTWKVRWS